MDRREDLKDCLLLIENLFELEDPELILRLIKKAKKHGIFFPHSRSTTIKVQKILTKLLLNSIKENLFLQERIVIGPEKLI
jgi:hypothetical protein